MKNDVLSIVSAPEVGSVVDDTEELGWSEVDPGENKQNID
jgi:hypothetical protein